MRWDGRLESCAIETIISCVFEICGEHWQRGMGNGFGGRFAASLIGSGSNFSDQGFEIGEDQLNRIEVWQAFRQEQQMCARGADRVAHRLALARAKIAADDDVARLEGGREELFDIGANSLAVDRAVEQAGRVDAVVAQCRQEGRGFPVALRDLVDQPFAAPRPASQARHVGFDPGFGHQAGGTNTALIGAQTGAMPACLRAILLESDGGLLYNGSPLVPEEYSRRRSGSGYRSGQEHLQPRRA